MHNYGTLFYFFAGLYLGPTETSSSIAKMVCYAIPILPKQNQGKRASPSISPSVRPRTFLHHGWMDFLHIGHHDQVL